MKRKLVLNSLSSIGLQIFTLISGLIIPRLIITAYGSEVNGLVSSITQFISYITLIEAGIGGVVRAALYKPLSEKNYLKVGEVLLEAKKYFDKLLIILIFYVSILIFIYPIFVNGSLGFTFTSSLILIISISTFSQYYFGITNSILLQADSKLYVNNFLQIFSILSNTILIILLIHNNQGIHSVKLVSSIVYTIKPILLLIYVRKNYPIKDSKSLNSLPLLNQKRSALVHQIAWFLHYNLNVILLSIFGTLKQVSVYMVYYMVVGSIVNLIFAFFNSFEPTFGTKIVTEKIEKLQKDFEVYSVLVCNIVFVVFFTAAAMLIPFIKLYTSGFSDANYINATFGFLLIFAELIYCLRLPYSTIVTASGKYKETEIGAFVEVCLNIFFSTVLVIKFGLTGVVIGTLVAMLYRTIYYMYFLSKNILFLNLNTHIRRNLLIIILLGISLFFMISNYSFYNGIVTYYQWIFYSVLHVIISSLIILLIDFIFYKKTIMLIIRRLLK
ncbi:TPA: lipopolysaccharide biosynthesis protein [Streptococcus suis]